MSIHIAEGLVKERRFRVQIAYNKMVYGYLLVGAILMGTAMWGTKYYSETGGLMSEEPEIDDTDTQINKEPTKKPSKKPPKTTSTTKRTTKKIRLNKAGYVGNGWWSSNRYFGWEPNSYPGLPWGTYENSGKRPIGGGTGGGGGGGASWGTFEAPPAPGQTNDWLENLQLLFVEGRQPGQAAKGFGGWLFGKTTIKRTTTVATGEESEEEEVSEYDAVVVTVSKDHLKPPPGGWGVDYNPYFYFNG